MPKATGESGYTLRAEGSYVEGEWHQLSVISTSGKTKVGTCSLRSGGGWICTVPVYRKVDNGIAGVTKQVGYASGRGPTAQDALKEADRKAAEGITAESEYAQQEMV